MDDEREVETNAPFGLTAKNVHLFLPSRAVPIEIDPDFADGDKRRVGEREQLLHAIEQRLRIGRQLGGVQSEHGATEVGPFVAGADERAEGVGVDVGQEYPFCTGLASALHDLVAVFVKLLGVEVAMGVDEHGEEGKNQ